MVDKLFSLKFDLLYEYWEVFFKRFMARDYFAMDVPRKGIDTLPTLTVNI